MVDDDTFATLLEDHAVGGVRLGRAPRRGDGLAAYDLTFSAPKSVSLMMAYGTPEVSAQVRAAHAAAVEAAVGWLEVGACGVRLARGEQVTDADGQTVWRTRYTRVDGAGFVGARFEQFTSRSLDPQLHTHHVVLNKTVGPDGAWRTLDGQRLYLSSKAAGAVYQAELRRQMSHRLGVAWGAVTDGIAEVGGFDREVIEHFSSRRRQILERVAVLAAPESAGALQAATSQTRPPKPDASPQEVQDRWQQLEGDAPQPVRALVARAAPHQRQEPAAEAAPLSRTGLDAFNVRLLDRLAGSAPTFARTDVVAAAADVAPAVLADPDALPTLADGWLAWARQRGELVALVRPETAGDLPIGLTGVEAAGLVDRGWMVQQLGEDGSGGHIRRLRWLSGEQRYTTRRLLALEQAALTAAGEPLDRPLATPESVAAARAAAPTLLDEQAAMAEQVAASHRRLVAVVGPGGSGKTYAAKTLARAVEADGHQVVGVAVSGAAADELGRAAAIPAFTVAKLRDDTARHAGAQVLPGRAVVVVDEASMVDSRDLAWLVDQARAVDGRVVLIGDPAQLPSVGAGGVFHRLVADGAAVDALLGVNVRQQLAGDRQALGALRAGDVTAAMARYRDDGRIHVSGTALGAMDALVAAWWDDVAEHGLASTRMLATRRSDVATLNALARARMTAAEQLTGPTVQTGGRDFQAGDRVVATRNHRRAAGIRNSHTGTITAVDPGHGRVTMRRDVDGAHVPLGRWYVERHLEHAYATTVHKAQGATFTGPARVYSDLEGATLAEHGYVALSRSRCDSHLYVGADQLADHIHPGVYLTDRRDPLARLADQLSASSVTPLGVDAGHPVESLSNPTLVRRRDELAQTLRTIPPDVSEQVGRATEALTYARQAAGASDARRGEMERLEMLAAQHADLLTQAEARARWLDRHGPAIGAYQDLAGELAARADRRLVELAVDPNARRTLGDPPGRTASQGEVQTWRAAAREYIALEQRHGPEVDLTDLQLTRDLRGQLRQLDEARRVPDAVLRR